MIQPNDLTCSEDRGSMIDARADQDNLRDLEDEIGMHDVVCRLYVVQAGTWLVPLMCQLFSVASIDVNDSCIYSCTLQSES